MTTWAAALTAAALIAAGPARAWDNQGHMATGAIAYDTLVREDPRLVARIVALMLRHPDRARFDRELGAATGAARDRLLFEYMARWPDDVGGTPADHEDWHYAERGVSPVSVLLPITFGHAEDALAAQAAIAADPQASADRRAAALCWVFHIVGDMQQPLHAGSWADLRFWKSDRGGTWAYVRRAAGAPPSDLHDFWDRAASLPGPEVRGAEDLARRIEAAHPRDHRTLGPAGPPRRAFRAWVLEDRALARDVVYNHGAFPASPRPADAPVAPAAYAARARAVSEARIALGGYRLAALLRAQMPR